LSSVPPISVSRAAARRTTKACDSKILASQ
jgi:hypothetical protein